MKMWINLFWGKGVARYATTLVLLLAACASSPAAMPTSTKTLLSPATNTMQPGVAMEGTQTFRILPTIVWPTTLPDHSEELFHLLHAENCTLPCYLGITPGLTSVDDAINILKSVGAAKSKELPQMQSEDFANYLDGWVLNIDEQFGHVFLIFRIIAIEDEIIRIDARINGPATKEVGVLSPTFFEFWERYSLISIFRGYGPPDNLYVFRDQHNRYSLFSLYEELIVGVFVSGIVQEGRICPQFRAGNTTSIRLIMTASTSPQELFLENDISPADGGVWSPVEDTLGLSADEFHSRLVASPGICFPIPNP